jgi:hypothetical protein
MNGLCQSAGTDMRASANRQALVTLWHIRPKHAKAAAKLRYQPSKPDPAYEWLANELRRRGIVRSSSQIRFAWYKYRGTLKPRPDLRESGHLPRGTLGIIETWGVSASSVAFMQFEMWVWIMNGWPIARDLEEMYWYQSASRHCLKRVRKTWHRVFELDWGDPELWGKQDSRALQACLNVTNVTRYDQRDFIAK